MKTISKSIVILALAMVLSSFALAGGGSEAGNGGDEIAVEFESAFRKALANMKKRNLPEFKVALEVNYSQKLPALKFMTVHEVLKVNDGGQIQESTAMNFPSRQLIKINRDRWQSIENEHLKEGLALHEMLSLVGLEGTGRYSISSHYVADYELTESDLMQNFTLKMETAHYQTGSDLYSLTATERWLKDPGSFKNIRIEYTLKKNGKVVAPVDAGGILYACADASSPLPEKFVEVLSIRNRYIGFMIQGATGCGNASQLGYQVVLPGKRYGNEDRYLMQEINSKARIIVSEKNGNYEFWSVLEEGVCGKVHNFPIPRLSVYQPRDFEMGPRNLPHDLNRIPEFAGFAYDNFASFFVGGIKDLDWELMNLSLSYFQTHPEFIERNRACGLPITLKEAQGKVRAMKELADTLKAYYR